MPDSIDNARHCVGRDVAGWLARWLARVHTGGMTDANRKYFGLTIVPNSDNSGAAPGYRMPWRVDCICGWSTRAAYQSEVRTAIRSHKRNGWPVKCVA